jgi:hypothetical protein
MKENMNSSENSPVREIENSRKLEIQQKSYVDGSVISKNVSKE